MFGRRVSVRALTVVVLPDDSAAEEARRVLRLVDHVHRVRGPYLQILIVPETNNEWDGSYEVVGPPVIRIDEFSDSIGFTLLHELGHLIDHRLLGGGLQWGSDSQHLAAWKAATDQSDAVASLVEQYWAPRRVAINGGIVVEADDDDLDYYLRPDELFARSYAQWVVTRAGDADLSRQLEASPRLSTRPEVLYAEQWDSGDFAPIAREFDRLMEELRWSR
jgi:hypothetical protein